MANNQYFDCPPIMEDGRLFSAYFPRCLQEYALFDASGQPLSNYDYRQYLIRNGDALLQKQRADAAAMGGSFGCTNYNNVPADQRVQSCSAKACAFSPLNMTGLGLGRS